MWRNQITGKIKVYALVVQSTAENSGDVLFELIWWVWPCVWFTWIQFDEICHVICKWTARHKYAGKLVDWIQLGGPLSGINSSTCWRQTRSLRFSRLSFRLGRLVEIAISLIGWKLWKVNMKTAGNNPPPGVHFFASHVFWRKSERLENGKVPWRLSARHDRSFWQSENHSITVMKNPATFDVCNGKIIPTFDQAIVSDCWKWKQVY